MRQGQHLCIYTKNKSKKCEKWTPPLFFKSARPKNAK